MSLLSYSFLVSDMDATLLNDQKEISQANQQAISMFRQKGGLFTLATGRSYTEAKRYIHQLEIDLPVILCNGAMMYDPKSQQVIPVKTLERSLVMEILDNLSQLPPSIDIFAYGLHQVYATKIGPLASAGINNIDLKLNMISSFSQIPNQPCIKVIGVAERDEMQILIEWSKRMNHLPVDFVLSSDNYFEILPRGASKGNAVTALLEKRQIPLSQASAIGDHLNDLSMLNKVGLSAAVKNAHPAVLQQAKVIVPSNNEHAIAHLIYHHLLGTVTETVQQV